MTGVVDDPGDEIWRPGYDGPRPVSGPISLATEPEPQATRTGEKDPIGNRTVVDGEPAPGTRDEPAPGTRGEAAPGTRDEPAPGTGTVGMQAAPSSSGSSPSTTPGWGGRFSPVRGAGGAVVVAGIAIAVAVMFTGDDDVPADSNADSGTDGVAEFDRGAPVLQEELPDPVAASGVPFAGADPKRLPDTLDPIWSSVIAAGDTDDVWVEVVDRRTALVAFGEDAISRGGSSTLQVLDAETGEQRWTNELEVPLRSASFVAATPDSIALVVGGTLTGLDLATGETVWRFERIPGMLDGDVGRLAGTELLAIGSSDGSSTLVDIGSGDAAGRLDGPTIGTDQLGRWYVRRGNDIVEYDLADGFSEPTLLAADVGDPLVAVVGRDVIASGPDGWTASYESDEWIPQERDVLEGADDLPSATGILPMIGSTFVVTGSGEVVGAVLGDRTLRSAWMRDGIATATYPTERGFLVLVVSQGGAVQSIIDGRTGDIVDTLTMTPGFLDSLAITGNGILTKKTFFDGGRLAGLDLDGVEMWSITDVTTASVGDRMIVTTTRLDDGSIRLAAIGEASAQLSAGSDAS